MTLKKIVFKNLPEDSGIAVFGMREDQWTVDGDPENTYFNKNVKTNDVEVDVSEPLSSKILIRLATRKHIWRTDKQFKNPITGRYSPELVIQTKEHEEFIFDANEYLEIDKVLIDRPIKTPLITIRDKSDFNPTVDFTLPSVLTSFPSSFGQGDDSRKNIVATLQNFSYADYEEFIHNLPRPIMRLIYPPLPLGNKHVRVVLFYFDFNKLDWVSDAQLKEEPWFYKKENQDLMVKARKDFVKLMAKNNAKILYLTTRELRNYDGRYLHEDFPLLLPEIAVMNNVETFWRYLSLPKFIDLITTSKLWFARPSTFSDPFESKTNKKTRGELVWKMMNRLLDDYNIAINEGEETYLKHQEWIVSDLERQENGTLKSSEYNNYSEAPKNLVITAEFMLNKLLDSICVNSWHVNKYESMGMWNLYTDDSYGIAIVSNFESLRDCFKTEFGIPKIIKVEYHNLHDPEREYNYLPSVYKHKAFQHEAEIRAYYNAGATSDINPGVHVEVDLNKLVNKIVLAPNSQKWFKENVEWIIKKAGYNFLIEDSIFKNKLY